MYCALGDDTAYSQLINKLKLVRSSTNLVFHDNGGEVTQAEWKLLEKAYIETYADDDRLDITFVVARHVSLGEAE